MGRSTGVSCWGLALGDGTDTARWTLTAVVGIDDAVEIATDHSCARRADGGVSCWGDNWHGQLGDGTDTERWTPTAVVGIDDAAEIAPGSSHSCARYAAGGVSCWGNNPVGQLGDGTTTDRWMPVKGACSKLTSPALFRPAARDRSAAGEPGGVLDLVVEAAQRRSVAEAQVVGAREVLGDGPSFKAVLSGDASRVLSASGVNNVAAGLAEGCGR